MPKVKHILVVSQYFYPEQFRINDICAELIKRGFKVTVLTGIPNYPQGKYYEGYDLKHKRKEEWNDINIIRIPLIARGNSTICLVSNYASFVVSGFIWNLFTNIKADVVFNYEVSPMTQALVGVWYAKKVKIPCYLYLTDLWPDNIKIVTGIKNRFIIGTINLIVDNIYKNCTKIFTSSMSFIDKLIDRGVPKSKLEFWPQYAEDFYKPIQLEKAEKLEIPQDGVFNLVFAGNIGYAQGLEVLVKAAKILKSEEIKVRFNIIGDGRYKNEFIKSVKYANVVEYFNFINKQPAEKIPIYIAECDASLICLSKSEVFSMTIPAKTQSCMACGKPILVVADGEIQKIVQEAKCGYVCGALDSINLSKIIKNMLLLSKSELNMLGQNARCYYENNFNKNQLLDVMEYYLKGNNNDV